MRCGHQTNGLHLSPVNIYDLKRKIAGFLETLYLLKNTQAIQRLFFNRVWKTVERGVGVATTFIENKYKFTGQDLWSCTLLPLNGKIKHKCVV